MITNFISPPRLHNLEFFVNQSVVVGAGLTQLFYCLILLFVQPLVLEGKQMTRKQLAIRRLAIS